VIRAAEGYAMQRTNNAKGDADRFLSVWDEYKNAKEVTRRRMFLETMKSVFPQIKRKIVIDSEAQGILPLLNLNNAEGE